jgi:beta-glucosidase
MDSAPVAERLDLSQPIALLSGGGFWHTRALPEAGVASVLLSDGPHGLRVQPEATDPVGLAGSLAATCFPPAVTLASSWDEHLVADVGAAVAAEASALGVSLVLGPGLNIKRHPLCGRNFEYFSEDPLLTGRLAAAMVRGIQDGGDGGSVGACLKHFAVNNQEYQRFVVDAVVDERTLREIYLAGFEYAVTQAKPWAVMAAYNQVNGIPCTQSEWLLTGVLRGEWGFDGVVVSDWGATGDRIAAVRAGMDLEMPGSKGLWNQALSAAARSDDQVRAAIARSAQRVVDLVARAGTIGARRDIGTTAAGHDRLARRAAAAGTVLLTNDGVLPLRPDWSVAVVGAFAAVPRYQGNGSSLVTPIRLTSTLDAFQARGMTVTYALGYEPVASALDRDLIAEASAVAAAADVAVVLVGLPASYESEAFDRDHLHLPRQHDELVAAVAEANPRTVVALSNGAPVLMPWLGQVAAVLETYLGGQASGGALVDVLCGDTEPGGRLAESFPAAQEDVAADPFFPGQPHQVEYREGIFVGYRHHCTAGAPPLFPFGHGLGYTTMSWNAPALQPQDIGPGEGVTVTLTVTNTGQRPGSDVVQVYVADRTGVVLRPRRELAGFAKIHLEPGGSVDVTIDVPARAFSFWDSDAASWRVPAGPFDVEIARSSANIVHSRPVTVHRGVTRAAEPPSAPCVAASDEAFERRLGRPIPRARPSRPFTRESTLGEVRTTALGRVLMWAIRRATPIDEASRGDVTAMKMLNRSLEGLPLRAVAAFSSGKLRWRTIDVLIDLFNHQPIRALRRATRRST